MIDNNGVQIERPFEAPVDLIWAMWTKAEHFANWYGPTGAKIPTADMDVRVGGSRRISMEMDTPRGPMTMHFVGTYLAVDPETQLVYSESLADAEGNALTAEQIGMPVGSPAESTIVVALEDLGTRTKMALTHVGVPAGSPGGRGWEMAIDKLQARVADLRERCFEPPESPTRHQQEATRSPVIPSCSTSP